MQSQGRIGRSSSWIALTAAIVCILGGCDGVASNPETLVAGEWKVDVEVTKVSIPGAPPEAQEAMASGFGVGNVQSQSQCLSKEEAELGASSFSEAVKQGSDCDLASFTAEGGTISGAMTCDMGMGMAADMDVSGDYTREAINMSIATTLKNEDFPEGSATMTVTMKAAHQGECAGQ
ncbi:MAG: DUF3617 family protein [Pseudomonadota bacterium]